MATTFMDIGHAKVILLIGTIINIGLFYEGLFDFVIFSMTGI